LIFKKFFVQVLIVSLLALGLPFFPASADGPYTVTVDTNSLYFKPGYPVYITGTLLYNGSPVSGYTVSLQVMNPHGGPAFIGQDDTDSNGVFEAHFTLPGDAVLGQYTVYASVVGSTGTSTFTVALTTPYTLTVQPGRSRYGSGYLQVTVSGQLTGSGPVENGEIWLRVEDPSGNLRFSATPTTDSAGNYNTTFSLNMSDTEGTYRIIAAYHPGAEELSSFVFDKTPPTVPTGLSAQAGPGKNSVSLTWTGVSDSNLGGYNIYRSNTSGSGYTKIGSSTSTSYIDTTATANGGHYYYVVTAFDDVLNESGYSSEASAIPWGDLDHFTFGTIGDQVAGVSFQVGITAYDAFNQIVQDFAGPASLSGFDGTVQPTSVSFTQGQANPNVTVTKAKTDCLTLSYNTITSTSNIFNVLPGALDHVTISPKTATITAGATQAYTLLAYDSYGNSWDVTSSATFTITPSAGGSWSNNTYTSEKAGTWTVTGSYSGKSDTATLEVLMVITTETLPKGGLMVPYSATLTTTGYTGQITWSYTGTLPGGLELGSSTGIISGTPQESGSFVVTFYATYDDNKTVSKTLTLEVDPTPIEVTRVRILNIWGTETSTFNPGGFYQVEVTIKNTIDFAISEGMAMVQSKFGSTIMNIGTIRFKNLASGETRLVGTMGFLLPNTGYLGTWDVLVSVWSNWAHAGGTVWSETATSSFVLTQ